MIVAVTPNPALDLTHEVDALLPGEVHTVTRVVARGGGKGVNVAAVVAAMGETVLAMGFAGGAVGGEVARDLDERGVPRRFTTIDGETRRSVAVVDARDHSATVLNELGPQVTAGDWARLAAAVAAAADTARGSVVVVSGSLPPGTPEGAVAALVRALPASARCILDIRGPQLVAALHARPELVKPNLSELRATFGGSLDVASGARLLVQRGARSAVVSDGAAGLAGLDADGVLMSARLAEPLRGNATGAGDAVAAGLAYGLARDLGLAELLRLAVAWGGAAVLQPVAGVVDPADVARLLPTVVLQERS